MDRSRKECSALSPGNSWSDSKCAGSVRGARRVLSRFVWPLQLSVKEGQHALAILRWSQAQRTRVQRSWNLPELFPAGRGLPDFLRVPARQNDISAVTNQKQRKRPPAHRFYRRNFARRETRELFAAVDHGPSARGEKCFAQERPPLQSRLVIGCFLQIRKRRLGRHGFDSRVGACGLQRDSCSHGVPQGKDMRRMLCVS